MLAGLVLARPVSGPWLLMPHGGAACTSLSIDVAVKAGAADNFSTVDQLTNAAFHPYIAQCKLPFFQRAAQQSC